MATGGNAIRGTRVGAGPMGEQDHGFHADRVAVSYWDALGNETVRYFAAGIPDDEIPETIDSPHSGLPAGRDKNNPPALAKTEPYKTHLAYVKERRTDEEAASLLDDALQQLRERRASKTSPTEETGCRRHPVSSVLTGPGWSSRSWSTARPGRRPRRRTPSRRGRLRRRARGNPGNR